MAGYCRVWSLLGFISCFIALAHVIKFLSNFKDYLFHAFRKIGLKEELSSLTAEKEELIIDVERYVCNHYSPILGGCYLS